MIPMSGEIVAIGTSRGGVAYGPHAIETASVMVAVIHAFGLSARRWVGSIMAIGVTAGTGISKDSAYKAMYLSYSFLEHAVAACDIQPCFAFKYSAR